MRTYEEAIKWLNNSVGKQYDFDLAFGYQCYDYANSYFNYMTGYRLSGMYAKDIPTDNADLLRNIATVYENTPNFLPLPGDIVIFNGSYGSGAGHDTYLYGGSNMSQDMYHDTAYGQRLGNRKDYGFYWLKRNQKPDIVVEFHLDAAGASASGGHVIISNQFNDDTIDNGIQSVIKSNLGQIRGVTIY